MPTVGEDGIERMGRDHEHMMQLIERILAECTQPDTVSNCKDCNPTRQGICHGNIEQLVRSFIETTMKHIMIESMLMAEPVPAAHRIAHNQAHMAIAQQLKAIRVVFSEDRNCVQAIEGIEQVHQALLEHFRDYDQALETFLGMATAAHPS